MDPCEGGAVAVLAQRVGAVCFEDVEAEAAEAGEHAWVCANARTVFGEGHIAAVVGGRLDPPVSADGLGGAGSGNRHVRDLECCLSGVAQQTGLAVAGEHLALDADDGGDERMPVAAGEFVGRIEDADCAALVAVAPGVAAMSGADRGGGGGDLLDLLVKGRLVVLDLNDQGDADFGGAGGEKATRAEGSPSLNSPRETAGGPCRGSGERSEASSQTAAGSRPWRDLSTAANWSRCIRSFLQRTVRDRDLVTIHGI